MTLTPLVRVVAARLISRTGGEAAFFVGIWGKLAYEFEGSPTDIAIVMAALGVAALGGSAVAGALVDRHGPKAVLIGAELLFVPAALSMVLVTDVRQFAVAVVALGLTSAPTFTAIAALPPFITSDDDELQRMNSLVEGAGMAALVTGSAIGAGIAATLGIDAIFVFDAVTSVVAVLFVIGLTVRSVAVEDRPRSGLAEIRAGFTFSWNHPRLRFYLGMGASLWVMFGLFTALEPLFFRDVVGVGPEAIGVVNSLLGAGLVVGTVVAARLGARIRAARVVVVMLALNGLGSLLYVGTSILTVVMVAGALWGVLIGVFAPAVRTMLHLNSPPEMVGRVMGTSQALAEIAKLGPLAIAPAIAAAVGIQVSLAASGLLLVVIAAASWRTATHLDETRTFDVTSEVPTAALEHGSVPHSADPLD